MSTTGGTWSRKRLVAFSHELPVLVDEVPACLTSCGERRRGCARFLGPGAEAVGRALVAAAPIVGSDRSRTSPGCSAAQTLRNVVREGLQSLGYTMLVGGSAEEALSIVERPSTDAGCVVAGGQPGPSAPPIAPWQVRSPPPGVLRRAHAAQRADAPPRIRARDLGPRPWYGPPP